MQALPLPRDKAALASHQAKYKRRAVENAKRSRFFSGKLDHIDLDRIDEPEEWARIPVLEKDMLRDIPDDRFFEDFCIAERSKIMEFWRSGGSTGKPLFYPRTREDIKFCMVSFARSYHMMAAGKDDIAHNSFPLGIHPAGHMWARAAAHHKVGVNWVGAGSGTPSAIQLNLLQLMQPTIWMGMPSYGLHLANLADATGVDLASGSVGKILTSAEPLSAAKREKLEREWGAEVFDSIGMTEITLMGCETAAHDGMYIWSDIAYIEVLDPGTLEPVAEGEQGTLVVTSLLTNNATPFLRWSSGDIVSWHRPGRDAGAYGVFPLIRHAHRTEGFFKLRGVNMNHQEFEDLMFRQPAVAEFKVDLVNDGGNDILKLHLELSSEGDPAADPARLETLIKQTFEVTPDIITLERGTIATEFEKSIKPIRFVDKR
jgi:phenylacetate-CoA ligase